MYAMVPPVNLLADDEAEDGRSVDDSLTPVSYLTILNTLGLAQLKRMAGLASWNEPFQRGVTATIPRPKQIVPDSTSSMAASFVALAPPPAPSRNPTCSSYRPPMPLLRCS